jgi:hypothetical protein
VCVGARECGCVQLCLHACVCVSFACVCVPERARASAVRIPEPEVGGHSLPAAALTGDWVPCRLAMRWALTALRTESHAKRSQPEGLPCGNTDAGPTCR